MESLNFEETKSLLERYNISLCPTKLATSQKEAAVFAKSIGYPVVLKIFTKKVLHKTDLGLIRAGIRDEEELRNAWDEIQKKAGGIKSEGILIQKQISGIEAVVGMKRDAQFGPVLMFGLGGILVELLKDVSFRIAPINKADAIDMMREIKGYKILKGFRGLKPVATVKLTAIIVALSELSLKEEKIFEIDFNPIIANEKGAWVVDPRFLVHNK